MKELVNDVRTLLPVFAIIIYGIFLKEILKNNSLIYTCETCNKTDKKRRYQNCAYCHLAITTDKRNMSRNVHETLQTIQDVAQTVCEFMGKGHSESVYQNAMIAEFCNRGMPCRSEVCCPFMYRNACVGYGKADIIVGNVIIELKNLSRPMAEIRTQLQRYTEALSELEKNTFYGAVVVLDKASGSVKMQAIDRSGTIILDSGNKVEIDCAKTDMAVLQGVFHRKYKFAKKGTGKQAIPYERLLRYLEQNTPNMQERNEKAKRNARRQIHKFISLMFHKRLVSSHKSKRSVMCYDKNGASIIML